MGHSAGSEIHTKMGSMRNIKQYTDHLKESSNQNELNKGLLDAAARGNLEDVRNLLDRGANVDAENATKHTPLHIAANDGRTEIARLLLDRGARIDAENRDKWTPLRWAAATGHTEVAKLLILNGADTLKAFNGLDSMIKFFKGDKSSEAQEAIQRMRKQERSRGAFGKF